MGTEGWLEVTTVANIRHLPPAWRSDPRYVYIGRAGRGFSGEYGNPHPVGKWCRLCSSIHPRAHAIAAFRADALRRYASDLAYRAHVEFLRGKVLVCYCFPQPCHADVYVELLDNNLIGETR